MRIIAIAGVAAVLASGCASVSTWVTPLDPARALGASEHTVILLEPPQRPHISLALIEARGFSGGTEGELLEAARREAASIGADAVVRLGVDQTYTPPLQVYDPVYSRYHWRHPLYFGGFGHAYPPYFGEHRMVGGGTALTLRALAIKYETDK